MYYWHQITVYYLENPKFSLSTYQKVKISYQKYRQCYFVLKSSHVLHLQDCYHYLNTLLSFRKHIFFYTNRPLEFSFNKGRVISNIKRKNYFLSCRITIQDKEVAQNWGSAAQIYQRYDSCMQTEFFTLSSKMNLFEATHILEIACGIGRLLPHTMSLKSQSFTYLATDISREMVVFSKEYISKYIQELGVDISLEEWLTKQRLSFQAHNGEEPLPMDCKFDRIICNFALNLTQSPEKMLKSLYDSAESECLLGVTINGSMEESNFQNALKKIKQQHGVVQKFRSYGFLHKKLGQMAEKIGWEVLVCWEQVMPYVFLEVDEFLHDFIVHILKLDENFAERLKENQLQSFNCKEG